MNYYNSKFLISYTFTIRREVSPLRSKQGKERENFVFLPLMSSVVETSLLTYYVFIKNSSFRQLEKSPSGFERTK